MRSPRWRLLHGALREHGNSRCFDAVAVELGLARIDCSMLGSLIGVAALQTSEYFGDQKSPPSSRFGASAQCSLSSVHGQ